MAISIDLKCCRLLQPGAGDRAVGDDRELDLVRDAGVDQVLEQVADFFDQERLAADEIEPLDLAGMAQELVLHEVFIEQPALDGERSRHHVGVVIRRVALAVGGPAPVHRVLGNPRADAVAAHAALQVAEIAGIHFDIGGHHRHAIIVGSGHGLERLDGGPLFVEHAGFPLRVVAHPHAEAAALFFLIALGAAGHPFPLDHVAADAAHFGGVPDGIKRVGVQRHRHAVLADGRALGIAAAHSRFAFNRDHFQVDPRDGCRRCRCWVDRGRSVVTEWAWVVALSAGAGEEVDNRLFSRRYPQVWRRR